MTRQQRRTTERALLKPAARITPAPGPRPMWNYEPCQARRGTIVIGPPSKPTFWSAPHAGKRWPCVEITYGKEVFYIADHDGSGWAKVMNGGGPDMGHYSLCDALPETFEPTEQ